ncbi:uncharacterized protein LOC144714656 [Wolffia australiana]
MAPLTNCLRKGEFSSNARAQAAFDQIKGLMFQVTHQAQDWAVSSVKGVILLPFTVKSLTEAMKYLHTQCHLHPKHAKWVGYLQSFQFCLKHKPGIDNRVADALTRR